MLVEVVELLLIFLAGTEDSKIFEVHEFAANRIDLFVEISAEFADEKTRLRISRDVFDDEFLENLRARF